MPKGAKVCHTYWVHDRPAALSRRVRPKTYSIGLILLGAVGLIEVCSLVSVFFLRSAVKIDLDAPAVVHIGGAGPETPPEVAQNPLAPESAAPTAPSIPPAPPVFAMPTPSPSVPEVAPTSVRPTSLGPETQNLPILAANGRLDIKAALDPHERIKALNKEADKYREENDLELARAALLEAETLDPNDLETLRHQADLAEAMSEQHRAFVYWQRIFALGPQIGDVQALAVQKLKALQPSGPPVVVPTPLVGGRVFATGQIMQTVLTDSDQTYEYSLQIPIVLQNVSLSVQPGDVRVQLYFYDLSAAGQILPTTAQHSAAFESTSPSWTSDKTETLYAHYKLTRSKSSNRSYGYLFRIFYQGKLQDEEAQPRKLLTVFPSVSPSSTIP